MENTKDNLAYFNLKTDNASAVVTLLHDKVADIEQTDVHYVDVGGKKKCVRCNAEGCVACARNIPKEHRIFIHLFNHDTGEESVWGRTDKILPQLNEIEQAWGDLSKIPLKIVRHGDSFPKYEITVMPAQKYASVDHALVEKKVGYRCYMTRSNEELEQFFATGVMPKHEKKEFLSKEEYAKKKEAERNASVAPKPQTASASVATSAPAVESAPHFEPADGLDDLPF